MTTSTSPPRNGLLSGMILTGAAAAAALVIGLFVPALAESFQAPLSEALLDAFFVSILAMAAHKAESYVLLEYERCPVYQTSGRAKWAQDPRQALFVGFVGTFLGMLLFVYLVMRGGPWPLLLIGIWLAQGLHEVHHAAKSLAERAYYPGAVSGLLFVLIVALGVFPAWAESVGLGANAQLVYCGALPLVFGAFFVEHRGWLRKLNRSPVAGGATDCHMA